MYRHFFKRVFDIVCALLALAVFSPLFLALMVIGTIKMKGNPFFTQERPGYKEQIFKLIKFRTMTNEEDEKGNLLPDEFRLNRYGRFLRSTSLDELPEAINILIGNMSVIGPRPLIARYLPYYTEEERHRHDVRPGLSGWAQVNGRSFISWEEKFKLDLEYVDHVSLIMDIKIVFMSVKKLFDHSDVEDATTIRTDEDGLKWCMVGGKWHRCYDAFDVERKRMLNLHNQVSSISE